MAYEVPLPSTATALSAVDRYVAVAEQAVVEAGVWWRRRGRPRTPAVSAVEYDERWSAQAGARRWQGVSALSEAVRLSSYGDSSLRALMEFTPVGIPAPDYFGWRAAKLAAILGAHGGRDEPVIEVGCGLGKNLLALAHQGFSRLCGLDVSRPAVLATREQLAAFGVGSVVEQADILDLGEHRELVAGGTVFTNYVLEQFPRHLEPILRRLAELGPRQVIHVEPCPDRLPHRRAWERLPSSWHARAHHYQLALIRTLRRLEERGVLTVLEVTPLGFSPYLFHSPVLLRWEPHRP
ncbi:MAG: class I SAM-dependent methyltransferase [Jatrophihabitantaceae bacterium]